MFCMWGHERDLCSRSRIGKTSNTALWCALGLVGGPLLELSLASFCRETLFFKKVRLSNRDFKWFRRVRELVSTERRGLLQSRF